VKALFVFAALLSLTAASTATDHATKVKIHQFLVSHLKPAELDLPRKRLADKIADLTADLPYISQTEDDRIENGGLNQVARSRREWIFLTRTQGDEHDYCPCAGFWLGVRGNRVVAQALPDDPDALEGPMAGKWRRHGSYLLGAGIQLSFHSQNFLSGQVVSFRETARGVHLLQNEGTSPTESIKFRSKTSDDVVAEGGFGDDEEFLTIQSTRGTVPQMQVVWRFEKGQYRKGKLARLHNNIWALDQVVTAARRRQTNILVEMVPDPALRLRLAEGIRLALRRDQNHVDGDGNGDMLGLYKSDWKTAAERDSPFLLHLTRRRNGKWIVDRMKRRPPER